MARVAVLVVACVVALVAPRAARAAAPPLLLTSDRVESTGHFDVLLDPERALTIETIADVPEDRWRPSNEPNPNFGFTSAAVWIRARLVNPSDQAMTRRFVFRYPLIDRIELFTPRPGGGYATTVNGDSVRYSERPFESHLLMFEVAVPARGETPVYARLTNTGSMQVAFDVMTAERLRTSESHWLFFHGAYYGLMIALGLYNLFLFLSIRTRAYLWYVVYVFVFTGTQLALDGTAGRFLFPEHPAIANTFVPFMVALLLNPPLLFAQTFLETRRHVPRLHRLVTAVIVINFIPLAVSLLAPYGIAIRVATVNAMLVCIGCLALGVVVMRAGYRPARFYVLAWSTVLIGTMLYGLMAWGVLPGNVFFANIQKVGGALEVILLSFALGDRIATLNAERDAAQRAALAMERDLAVSATVQRLFLPKDDAYESAAVALRGFYAPAAQSGGDWWWYEAEDDRRVRVLLGDVTGHGVGPAMVTAAVAAAYRAMPDAARHGHMRRVIDALNDSFSSICAGAHHMTLGALEIDARAGVVRMWSAGAPAALLMRADGTVDALAARGSPLGTPGIRVGEVSVPVRPGDRVFVFSDGLFELALPSGRPLGYRGVTKMLQRTAGRSTHEAREQVARELRDVLAQVPQLDDVAFVIVDVLDSNDARAAA